MLLNEIQKQHKTIEDLESRIAALEQLLKTNTSAVAH
jgi:t-SNARE complex subunit (syntaxin)